MQPSGQYGLPDMQQFMLAAGATPHHMFAAVSQAHQDAARRPQLQQQQQQQLHQSLRQQQQAAEMLDLYHRQGIQEQHALHHSRAELRQTQSLFSLHHHQQQQRQQTSAVETSLHLPLAHHMSLGSESSEIAASTLVTRPLSASHHQAPQFKPLLAASNREAIPTMAGDGDDDAELGAEDGEKGAGGSRWPREETLALLGIRSEMDALFRDSGLKGPLWEEVSRKLYHAGYQRSAKQCKEKFENVHKYYKKTKDMKADRQDGKTYRFHTELEAIYAASQEHDMEGQAATASALDHGSAPFLAPVAGSGDATYMLEEVFPPQIAWQGPETSNGLNSSSSTSCGESGENLREVAAAQGGDAEQQSGRKRNRSSWRSMRAFFENLSKQVMERQDALHQKFLESIERRDEELLRREETYKRQEVARLNREHELRAQEHALAATRDAALVVFLKKVTGETLHLPAMPPVVSSAAATKALGTAAMATIPSVEDQLEKEGSDANTRRWPKVEVLALIRIRTSLEPRFQEAGPKAHLWEEVSASMAGLGFSRSTKRCKEKWENINKYFRKTKDNACRKRSDSSSAKTCPYFHELEVLYESGILASPNSSTINKSAKVDSEDLLESSKDDSQQTQIGNPDHRGANNVMAVVATGGRENNAAGCSTTSSTGTTT